MTTLETLKAARKLITPKKNWTQGVQNGLRVHIKRRDSQAAKAYVEGFNAGLEAAAVGVESGVRSLSKEFPIYKWAVSVAKMIRAKKTEATHD